MLTIASLKVKFSLYLKKAGLASRNMVQHLPKKSFHVVSVSASIFLISMPFDGSIDGGASGEKRCGVAQRRLSPGNLQKGPESRKD